VHTPGSLRLTASGPAVIEAAARLKLLTNSPAEKHWRIVCGRAHPCPGELGEMQRWRIGAEMVDVGISHPHRYRQDDQGVYHVLKPPRRASNGLPIGRRRLPDRLQTSALGILSGGQHSGGRTLLGQHPSFPCVIACPICGTLNHVERPPDG
jgi:hypothetical protein